MADPGAAAAPVAASRRARIGRPAGRPQSAVLVPVPAAEAVVGHWRQQYDPVAAAGVPAHVTLIVPWVDPGEIGDAELALLEKLAAATPAFSFELVGVAWFGRRVLWLVPQPAGPFRDLTVTLAERFRTPPWAGAFDEVIPHLTVAHAPGGDAAALEPVVKDLWGQLPVRCRAEELWVMIADGDRWAVRGRCPLG